MDWRTAVFTLLGISLPWIVLLATIFGYLWEGPMGFTGAEEGDPLYEKEKTRKRYGWLVLILSISFIVTLSLYYFLIKDTYMNPYKRFYDYLFNGGQQR